MVDVYGNVYHLLKSILSGKSSFYEVEKLARITLEISLDRLTLLIRLGKLNVKNFQILLKSIATDCIADLFKRDNSGQLIEFMDIFSEENDINILDEDDAKSLFRSLVFTSVNDGITRMYRTYNPIYSKILQNIRHHARKIHSIKKFEMFNEAYFFSCDEEDLNTGLPEYPIEELENDLSPLLNGDEDHKDYFLLILRLLNEQEKYRRCCSQTNIACIIRRLISRQMSNAIDAVYYIDNEILNDEIPQVIACCVNDTKMLLKKKFLGKNKLSEDLFEKYYSAIEEIIFYSFVQNDGDVLTAFDYLKKYLPEITVDKYQQEHCNKFEYMIKIAKNKIKEQLKELL